jgi:hypothetical protein
MTDEGQYTLERAQTYDVLVGDVGTGGLGMRRQVADDWLSRWDRLSRSREDDRQRVGYWADGLRWIRTTRTPPP